MSRESLPIYILTDLNNGAIYYRMTCKGICEMLGVSESIVRRHNDNGRPINGRYEVRMASKIENKRSPKYLDRWQMNFIEEWKSMQKNFGVEVRNE